VPPSTAACAGELVNREGRVLLGGAQSSRRTDAGTFEAVPLAHGSTRPTALCVSCVRRTGLRSTRSDC
jgi:hypothetical protein